MPEAASAVDQGNRPIRQVRRESEHDGRGVALRCFLEGLRTDEHADIEQDGQDGHARDQRQHHRDRPKPAEQDHRDPRRRRIADSASHRLPARMADIDRVDERIAHEASDQAYHAVRAEHAGCGKLSPATAALSTLSIASTRS